MTRLLPLWLIVLLAAGIADAQNPDQRPGRERRASQPAGPRNARPADDAGPRRGRMSPDRPLRGRDLGRWLFRAAPEDEGPLRPGEENELLEFARQHMPRFHQLMRDVRQRKPERFRQRLAEHAPRLRHLKRVFAYSPRVGRIIRAHAENTLRIQREARAVRDADAQSPTRAQALASLRALVAENVRLEADALDALADELAARRAPRLDERVAQLTAAGADLEAEAEELRALVRAYHSAADDDARRAALERVETAVARQLDAELDTLRQRVAELRANAAEDVDRRIERLTGASASAPAE